MYLTKIRPRRCAPTWPTQYEIVGVTRVSPATPQGKWDRYVPPCSFLNVDDSDVSRKERSDQYLVTFKFWWSTLLEPWFCNSVMREGTPFWELFDHTNKPVLIRASGNQGHWWQSIEMMEFQRLGLIPANQFGREQPTSSPRLDPFLNVRGSFSVIVQQ